MKIRTLSQADNCQKWRNLPISNPKPDLHNINVHTKFVESSLIFTQVIAQKRKRGRKDGPMEGHTYGRRTGGNTDNQRDTTILRHYHVAGYKKLTKN